MSIFNKKTEWLKFNNFCIRKDQILFFQILIEDKIPTLSVHHKKGNLDITYRNIEDLQDDYTILQRKVGLIDSFYD